MINMDIDSNVKTILTEIYEYSQTGIGTADLECTYINPPERPVPVGG